MQPNTKTFHDFVNSTTNYCQTLQLSLMTSRLLTEARKIQLNGSDNSYRVEANKDLIA